MQERRSLLAALTAGLSVAIAGCTSDTGGESGGGDSATPTEVSTPDNPETESSAASDEPTATPTEEPTATSTDSSTTAESQATVSIPGLSFDPLRLSVEPGTTVVWANESSSSHDVVSAQFHDKSADWEYESETFSNGGQVSYTFESEGVYEYLCSIHGEDSMSGAILVGDVTLDADLPSEGDADLPSEDDDGYY